MLMIITKTVILTMRTKNNTTFKYKIQERKTVKKNLTVIGIISLKFGNNNSENDLDLLLFMADSSSSISSYSFSFDSDVKNSSLISLICFVCVICVSLDSFVSVFFVSFPSFSFPIFTFSFTFSFSLLFSSFSFSFSFNLLFLICFGGIFFEECDKSSIGSEASRERPIA